MRKLFIFIFAALVSISIYGQNYMQDLNKISLVESNDFQQNICISRDKKYMAIATLTAIKIVDVQNFKIVRILPVSFRNIKELSFLSDNDKVLIVGNHKDSCAAEIYNWRDRLLVKKLNPVEKGEIFPTATSYTKGDFLVCIDKKNQIFLRNTNTLELIIKFPGAVKEAWSSMPVVNEDGSLIAFSGSNMVGKNATLYVYDNKGVLKYSKAIEKNYYEYSFNGNNEITTVSVSFPLFEKYSSSTVSIINFNTGKETIIAEGKELDVNHVMLSSPSNFVVYEGTSMSAADPRPYSLSILFLADKKIEKIVSNNFGYELLMRNVYSRRYPCFDIAEDIFLISSGYENFNYIVDTKNRTLLGFLYSKGNGLAFVSADGRFTGDNEAIENLQYAITGRKNITLASQIDQLFTPKLLNQILDPNFTAELSKVDLNKIMKFAPELRITSPDSLSNQKANFVTVKYKLKDNGDGIREVKFYVNGKVLNDNFRGQQSGDEKSRDIQLINGDNIIDAVAISNSGYQSSASRIVAKYRGGEVTTNLFILGIGIDQYKNPKYNLNYAVTDAEALTDFIKSKGTGIFSSIDSKVVTNQMATKANILAELKRISEKINETDVFVLFYAGHGVMSEGTADVPKDYFLALTDITQMYGNDQMLSEKGISAVELREWCKNIKAQKQVILLDACQSGGATEIFAMRGASEEKAIIQLAQSTGVFLISSAGAEQFATEYEVLKHGLFTYALLEGLGGKADGGSKDGKITIKEIEAFLNDIIPELSQKYKGSTQFPNTWSKGMDFPVVIAR